MNQTHEKSSSGFGDYNTDRKNKSLLNKSNKG